MQNFKAAVLLQFYYLTSEVYAKGYAPLLTLAKHCNWSAYLWCCTMKEAMCIGSSRN